VLSKYLQSYRRMLVDMHIPDWAPEFLSHYNPVGRMRAGDRWARPGLRNVR
jgi:hypothetical protein